MFLLYTSILLSAVYATPQLTRRQNVAAGINGLGTNADGALNGQAFCDAQNQINAIDISDGTQHRAGSCSLTVQGSIPSFDNMVSTLITQPADSATLDASVNNTVTVSIQNLQTGFFSDAGKQYYTSGQQLNAQGLITGHQHISVQELGDGTSAPDARKFEFFKGLNDASPDGKTLSTVIPGGSLKTNGLFRICSITGAFTHQPVIMPVAQRGSQDDCIRITVKNAV